jgi:hypothetical protein
MTILNIHSNYRSVYANDCYNIVEQVEVYQEIKNPKEEEIGKNLPCSLWIELSPQGGPGTDDVGLNYTEDLGDQMQGPEQPFQDKSHFTINIT